MEEKKKSKKKIIIIISIILGVLLVGVLSYMTYDKVFKKDNETREESDNQGEVNNGENLTTDEIYKRFEVLLSVGYFDEEFNQLDLDLSTYILTVNDNGSLIYTYYDENDKKHVKQIEEISNVSKIYNIHFGGADCGNIILTKDGLIYHVRAVYFEGNVEVTRIFSNKKAEKAYIGYGEIIIVFEDKSLGILDFLNDSIDEKVGDLNYIISGFRFSACSSYCPPKEIIVKADGDVKILKSVDDDGEEEYTQVVYNNKKLNLKYIYHDVTEYDESVYASYTNIYFVDTNNNIYILKDYNKDGKMSTNLEKLSYKFDSYQIDTVTSEYGYDYNEYTVKYDNGNTLKAENFIDLSKYSKVFEVFNN